ncbi:minor capsid protein [Candidatus Pacearchaeota archaeon]|nr:minor capsid protein [Candidatus Pacearchaeota archaeon]
MLGAQVGAIGVDESWMHKYQLDSYQLSLDRFQAELVLQGASIVPTAAEAQAALFLQPLAAIPSLGGQINPNVIAPIHRDALEFLFTRSLESLEGWTDNLARETRQITMDSITQGRGINETVRELQRRIDVSRSRAELIARTEVSQAFQHASNNEAIRASEALGEPILLRWITARDVKVRHLHSRWHGQLSNVKENARRISLSAFNCRCVQVPVIAEANTAAKNRKFESQRTALLALENS